MKTNIIKWKTGNEVLKALRIPARSTLKKMRDSGKIDFVKIGERKILYPDWVLSGLLKNPSFEKHLDDIKTEVISRS
ncbi:MAG: hypothetical protein Q8M15_14655 [Bacteroidota bacterium]|nr:hypothetical protein [Bacteroidota bacterium]